MESLVVEAQMAAANCMHVRLLERGTGCGQGLGYG